MNQELPSVMSKQFVHSREANLNRVQLGFDSSLETVRAIVVFQEDQDTGTDKPTLIGTNYVRELELVLV